MHCSSSSAVETENECEGLEGLRPVGIVVEIPVAHKSEPYTVTKVLGITD